MIRRLLGRVRGIRNRDRQRKSASRSVSESIPEDWNDHWKGGGASSVAEASCSLEFRGTGSRIEVPSGTTILEAVELAGIELDHFCGGMCSCGSCRVTQVEGDVSEMDDIEEVTLELVREGAHDRLACQTRILGAVSVTIPSEEG